MPFWVPILIKIIVDFGLPFIEKELKPQLTDILHCLIKQLNAADDQKGAIQKTKDHIDNLSQCTGTAPNLIAE